MALARVAALVLLATGCNAVFGIERTELPPPDALPSTCPALGSAPHYSGTFHQLVIEDCSDYSPSFAANVAMGVCYGGSLYSGQLDMPLTPLKVSALGSEVNLRAPRVLPEGNVAFIDNNNFDFNNGDLFAEYDAAGTTWNLVGDTGIPHGTDLGAYIGAVTRAPNRHLMWTNGKDGSLHELVQSASTTWTEAPTTAALGLPEVYDPANLTPDGLHLIVHVTTTAGSAIYYSARASIDDAFPPAVALTGVPEAVTDPVMTEDCTRVYFTGVARLFYVEQI